MGVVAVLGKTERASKAVWSIDFDETFVDVNDEYIVINYEEYHFVFKMCGLLGQISQAVFGNLIHYDFDKIMPEELPRVIEVIDRAEFGPTSSIPAHDPYASLG